MSKVYPGQPPVRALDRVSLAVAAGELVAIVGPSGSGKSTLLHLMGTLDKPTTGTVRVTGLDVAAADRPGAGRAAGDPDRVRVPAVLPRRAPDRAGQRGRRAALRRRPPRRAAAAGAGGAGPGRAGAPGRRPADPAVRRRAAAGRDRPGGGGRAADGAGRRAHRQPRLGHRRRHPGPAGRTQPAGHDGRHHHPRPRGRRPRPGGASRCSTGTSSPTPAPPGSRHDRHDRHIQAATPPRPRPGCARRTWPPWPASGCGPASCAPGCRRWASRSASRRSSPSWAWPPPPRPRCWPRSPGWAPTC